MDADEEIIQLVTRVDTTVDLDESDLTPIQEFFKGKTVFLTGCTGFLGQVLLEKLLRSCPVSKIYVLARSKKGKSLESRIEDVLNGAPFQRVRNQFSERLKNVVAIEGDCALPDLGLGDPDKRRLIDEVDIVFHVAATVRFDEQLKNAVFINLRATRDLMRLARQMTKLKSFIHVSTMYSNCIQEVIKEEIYPPAAKSEEIIALAEKFDDTTLNVLTPSLIESYPNTYIYTKQIAEAVVEKEGDKLPVGIHRPAIVVSTYREPIRGWTNNVNGPLGFVVGSGMGVLRVILVDPEGQTNLVPVDMCINSIIASAWDVGETFRKAKLEGVEYKLTVYNFESSTDNPLIWKEFLQKLQAFGIDYVPVKAIWYCYVIFEKNYIIYRFLAFLLHTIPGLMVDGVLVCMGKRPMLTRLYVKVGKVTKVLRHFSTKEWTMISDNVRKVLNKMSERDKEIFFSDIKKLNWDDAFRVALLGGRIYLLKDPIETLPEARRRHYKLYWAHQFLKAFLMIILVWTIWALLSSCFNILHI